LKWSVPSGIIEQGRFLLKSEQEISVQADLNRNIWLAEVSENLQIFQVNLDGSPKEQDVCQCSYWLLHGYCQHTVAVELFLREKGWQRVISQNSLDLLPKFSDVDFFANILTQGLTKFNENSQQDEKRTEEFLNLEYYLAVIETDHFYPELSSLVLILKIGRKNEKRTLLVKNITEFLSKYFNDEIFIINERNQFHLKDQSFSDKDNDILKELNSIYQTFLLTNYDGFHVDGRLERRFFLLPVKANQLLSKIYATKRFFWEEQQKAPIIFQENNLEDVFKFKIIVKDAGFELRIKDLGTFFFKNYYLILKDNTIYSMTEEKFKICLTLKNLLKQIKDEKIYYSAKNFSDLFRKVLPILNKISAVELAPEVEEKILLDNLTIQIYLTKHSKKIGARVDFIYGDVIFSTDSSFRKKARNKKMVIRNTAAESSLRKVLRSFHYKKTKIGYEKGLPKGAELYHFFNEELTSLRKVAKVQLDSDLASLYLSSLAVKSSVQVEEKNSWLSINFDISNISKGDVDIVLESLKKGDFFAELKTGQVVDLSSANFKEAGDILQKLAMHSKKANHGKITVPLIEANYVDSLLKASSLKQTVEVKFQNMIADLSSPEHFPADLPSTLKANLRDYQIIGFRWFKMLSSYSFGGILADEMGLGKSLQAISYLASEQENGNLGTALIVVPASLTYNWLEEFKKFSPTAKVLIIDGKKNERTKKLEKATAFDVLLISYYTLRQDINELLQLTFGYLILDEAQMAKNSATKSFQALAKTKAQRRFALSGTPIENNLDELWSISKLILPNLFSSKQKFREMPQTEIIKKISPFILRREKKDVLLELPEKIETNIYNTLTDEQKTFYLAYLREMQKQFVPMDSQQLKKNSFSILAGLTRLRQICDDPRLIDKDYPGTSGKLEQLKELLLTAQANKHRVLLFSQFTSMLSLIEEELKAIGLTSFYLRGSTDSRSRVEMVQQFNQGARDVFLISVKAGGTGLNLTGADTVILYDLWWNPAVEEQAAARAHRIGQKNKVQVLKMITQGTIEERIADLQNEKRELFSKLVTGLNKQQQNKTLTIEDWRMILSNEDA